jgi:hypothetical protein
MFGIFKKSPEKRVEKIIEDLAVYYLNSFMNGNPRDNVTLKNLIEIKLKKENIVATEDLKEYVLKKILIASASVF